eukprot:scaffold292717_cov18-Tisochrysis_lutea.AAC.3
MEKRNMAAANEKPPFLPVLANCFAYAGMPEQADAWINPMEGALTRKVGWLLACSNKLCIQRPAPKKKASVFLLSIGAPEPLVSEGIKRQLPDDRLRPCS